MPGRHTADRSSGLPDRRFEQREGGYNLVVLVVLITVMNIAVAVALPAWTNIVKREKEEETIFRGMQYAEAIRVFQKRNGRLPVSLEELVERQPRSLRQLYSNPLDENGEWGLLVQTNAAQGGGPQQGARGGRQGARGQANTPVDGQTAQQQQQQQQQEQEDQGRRPRGGSRQDLQPPNTGGSQGGPLQGPGINPQIAGGGAGRYVAIPPGEQQRGGRGPTQRTTGPIVGVYPAVDEASLRTFFGKDNYSGWHFTMELVPMPVVIGERGPPRVSSEWVGRPFRKDLEPPQGQGPGGPGIGGRGGRAYGSTTRYDSK